MSSDATNDFIDTLEKFHRYFIPIVGTASLGVLIFLVFLAHFQGHRFARLARGLLILSSLFQAVVSVSYLVSAQWTYGVQLSLTGLFSFWAGLNRRSDTLKVNAFVNLFNAMALLGILSLFNFQYALYTLFDVTENVPTSRIQSCIVQCQTWFGLDDWDDSPLCFQYITAMRALSYFLIFLAAFQTFLSYFLAKAPQSDRDPSYEEVSVNTGGSVAFQPKPLY